MKLNNIILLLFGFQDILMPDAAGLKASPKTNANLRASKKPHNKSNSNLNATASTTHKGGNSTLHNRRDVLSLFTRQEECIPPTYVICPNDPLMCCPPGDVCIPAEFACCPAADPELCPDEFCYPEGSTCCSPSGACPASERCCGPYCCTGTDQCCSGIEGCCDIEASCCTDGCCDAPNTQCCGTEYCCPPGANCCDGEYCCPEGEECCNDGCCAEGTTCCGEWCCAEGTTCCGGEECCGENFICDPDEPGKCLPVMEFQYTPLVMDQTVKNMCMRIGPSNQMILHWSDVRNDGGKCDGCCSNVTVPSGPFVGEATSCDEFPFATSAEALLPGAHLACVDAYENSFQGNWIARYRAALGLVQGQKFLVKVIGFDCASVNPADLLGCGGVPGGTWA